MISAVPVAGLDAARVLAAELKRRWRRGEPPNAVAALGSHRDLACHKSIVVDLAYEEYLLREKAGAAPDPVQFADQFPTFRASIRNMLDAHRLLTERPELLDPAAGAWPEAGTHFEGLELLAELGRGAFGRAYLAFDNGTDRLCVLKFTTGKSAEARVIGRLAHPHVTDVYWARAIGFRTAVCMPFVGVSTLADIISASFPPLAELYPTTAHVILKAAEADELVGQADRRSVPVVCPGDAYLVGACAVAARIAGAVDYLHREGVVHGDLKPSNVVIGPGGAPHLIDFNLSTFEIPSPAVHGTPAYMAPELLEAALAGGTTAGINAAKADLFSLGVVIVELLTGRLPFPPDESGILGTREGTVRSVVLAVPDDLPPAVTAILASCLAFDPNSRPHSARDVAAGLDRFVMNRRNRGRRLRRRAITAACLAILGSGVAVVAKVWPTTTQGDPVATERAPETADEFIEQGRKYLRVGNIPAARAAFIAAHELSGNPWAMAFVAYGMALSGQTGPSIEAAKRAIKDGAVSAEVLNNLGYALSQSARPADAIPHLDEALRLSPRMKAALYNRAMARYRAGLRGAAGTVDARAAEDITAALAVGPLSPELLFDAARIYAICSANDPALRAVSCQQIRAAIQAGKDPTPCRKDAVLVAYLGTLPAFEAACATTRGEPPTNPPQLRLLEPRP